jgi:eukaryotic-like serine/threonine-protein kinase
MKEAELDAFTTRVLELAALPPPPPPDTCKLDARFDRRALLGRGGLGEVWLAEDRLRGTLVALKVLHRVPPSSFPSLMEEAQLTMAVRHPNVVQVLDAGELGGVPFVALAVVEGESLRAMLKRGLAPDRVRLLLVDVAAGLTAAHAAGILHLDVKPENILVTHEGRAQLADFGLARRAAAASACVAVEAVAATAGTPAYMAPELWKGEMVCDRTDVWSFAIVAFEALTGRSPVRGASPVEIALSVLTEGGLDVPNLPELPGELAALLNQSLDQSRVARPHMDQLLIALQTWARFEPAAGVGGRA